MATLSPFARDAYEIHSPRLTIRTAVESDAEGMREFITNQDNNPHTPTESDVTIEYMRTRVGKWRDATAQGTGGFQVITLRSTGELIGYGGYNCFNPIEETAVGTESPRYLTDIGVMIAKSRWRKGFGLEAFCALTEYAFVNLGITQVRIQTDLANEPWRSLMSALELSRLERQQRLSYDEDTVGYAWHLEATDWQVVKEGLQKNGRWLL
jgi:RimJ/RimL family protein N-acetyltransferase